MTTSHYGDKKMKKLLFVLLITIATGSLQACATAKGAAAGAVIGGLAGNASKGAKIGAGVGLAVDILD
jgi:hypothetical protein